MRRRKGIINWLLWICCIVILPIPIAKEVSASPGQFTQGSGYEKGLYDQDAVQPAAFNWTRQSRFSGSEAFDVKWSFETDGPVRSSPAIARDGTIYVGSNDGFLYAITPDGKEKWSFETRKNYVGHPLAIYSSPSIGSDGTIYVGSDDAYLYALNPDGSLKWETHLGSLAWVISSPAIGADGTIYVGTNNGTLYAIMSDGQVKWSYRTTGIWPMIESSPVIAQDGTIYIADFDGVLYAFSPDPPDFDNVEPLWTYDTQGGSIKATPVIGEDGTIYMGSQDGNLYVLNPNALNPDEELKWTFASDSINGSPVIGSDGTIYVIDNSGVLYALDPDHDSEEAIAKWHYDIGEIVYSSPIISADGVIYVGKRDLYNRDHYLYAIDTSGNLRWKLKTGGAITSSAAIGPDGMIYVGSHDGKLYAIGQVHVDTPSGVVARAGEGKIDLAWDAVAEASTYLIYMAKGSAPPETDDLANWTLIDDEPISETSYMNEELDVGEQYWFAVRAVTEGNSKSQLSAPVTATPYASVTGVNALDSIEIGMRIPFDQLELHLPRLVEVEIGHSPYTLDVEVQWEQEETEYNPYEAGIYKITGTMQLPEYLSNPLELRVELMVRVMANSNAKLSEIRIDGVPITDFQSAIFTYHLAVPYSTEHLTVTAVTYDPAATYEVLGGASRSLDVGDNPVAIVVTAEDRIEQSTYSLYIERQQQPTRFITDVQALDDIEVAYGSPLSDIPMPDTVTVILDDHSLRNLSIVWDEGRPIYTGSVSGTYQFTGTLQLPENVENPSDIEVKVTVIVLAKPIDPPPPARTPPVILFSNNANLSDLQVQADGKLLELQPSFAPDITEYTIRTDAEKIEIAATAAHYAAKVMMEDVVLTSGITVSLTAGENEFTITVQAENGTKKQYQLIVEREVTHTEPIIQVTDIDGHWAESFIQQGMEMGIIGGYPDGTFQPDRPITRVEFTVMLVNAMQLQGDSSTLLFSDSGQIGDWAKQAVALATQAGIVLGYEDGSFRPSEEVTRAEMAVMIARAWNISLDDEYSFTSFEDDVHIPQWARSSVEALHRLEVINGRGDNRFVPKGTASRAEATVVILRLLDLS